MKLAPGIEDKFPDCGAIGVTLDAVECHVVGRTVDDEIAEPRLSLVKGGIVCRAWIQLVESGEEGWTSEGEHVLRVYRLFDLICFGHVGEDVALVAVVIHYHWDIVELAELEGFAWEFLQEFTIHDWTVAVDTVAFTRAGVTGVLHSLVERL